MQLTSRGLAGSPRWSPDGRFVAFDSTVDGRWQILVIGASGGRQQQITQGVVTQGVYNARPNWSRDGKWLYFTSTRTRTGRQEVWKVPAGGGSATQVTRNGGNNAVESPDGTAIYYDLHGTIMKAQLKWQLRSHARRCGGDRPAANLPRCQRGYLLPAQRNEWRNLVSAFRGRQNPQDTEAGQTVVERHERFSDGRTGCFYTQQDGQPGSDLMLAA